MNREKPFQSAGFRFIDLFAGIGGLRIPFDEISGRCVFTSEVDKHARETYQKNFKDVEHHMNTDIRELEDCGHGSVPDHDLLLAGFPCQPFSNAGKRLGVEDTRGTLFFDVAAIIKTKLPRVVLLENVRGLLSSDQGRTIQTIEQVISDLGYVVYKSLLNARDFGLPQNRVRLFIVAIRVDVKGAYEYVFPRPTHKREDLKLGDILDDKADSRLVISDRLWAGHQARRSKNRDAGKGFGYQIFSIDSPYSATLSARYYKDGSEILIERPGANPRKLSINEARKLQGFPEWFRPSESNVQAYKQFGNAVPVSVVTALAGSLAKYLVE